MGHTHIGQVGFLREDVHAVHVGSTFLCILAGIVTRSGGLSRRFDQASDWSGVAAWGSGEEAERPRRWRIHKFSPGKIIANYKILAIISKSEQILEFSYISERSLPKIIGKFTLKESFSIANKLQKIVEDFDKFLGIR